MAIPVNIQELIHPTRVESTRIEYKENFNPDPVIRTICAFANDIDNIGGGYIVIGVEEENGSPKFPIRGIEKSGIDTTLKKLREFCHYIEPLYEPIVEPVMYDGVYLIVIWVPGGFGRPYKAPKSVLDKHPQKHYYIRKFANSVIASIDEERELFYISSNIPFDDRENPAAGIEDLSLGLMQEHLKEIKSTLYNTSGSATALQLATDLQIVAGPPENLRPRNVGLLMFCEHPEKYFRYARIEVVDIPDPTGRNMVEKVFTGPIQRQLRDALQYMKNYVVKEAVIKTNTKAEAVRIQNYPYAAVEEILANAVYHRSYQINEPVTVRITPNQIEITSFPGFDRSITDEAIANEDIRARAYRNRRIGDFLKELGLIEGRNTGFPNARKALLENGSPKLSFLMDRERDYLSVVIGIHPYFSKTDGKSEAYDARIIDALSESALSLTELARAMGYKGMTAKLRKAVDRLLLDQKLESVLEGQQPKLRAR